MRRQCRGAGPGRGRLTLGLTSSDRKPVANYDPAVSTDGQPRSTAATTQLLDGLSSGTDVRFEADDGERSSVDATEIRDALVSAPLDGDPRPITMSGADVTGALDLRNVVVDVPLTFENCTFDQPILLDGAMLEGLAFVGCPFVPGIVANGCTIRHNLVIDRTTIRGAHPTIASMRQTAAVWLCEARLGGRLLIRNGAVIDGDGGRSIQADRVVIGANIRILSGSTLVGQLRLLSAQVSGSLDLISSTVSAEHHVAVDLAEARFGGSVFVARTDEQAKPATIDGIVVMSDARVGAFVTFRGAVLNGRAFSGDGPYDRPRRGMHRTAILAPRCEIGDDLHIDGATVVHGGIAFPHAMVLGDLLASGLRIENPGDRSLDLGSADISGTLIARRAQVLGTAWMAGCRISGSLALEESTFTDPDGAAVIQAAGLEVGGDVQLDELVTRGGALRFRAIDIGGEVRAERAVLDNPGGETLSLSNAQIKGAIKLEDLSSTGLLAINRATAGGRLELTGATLVCATRWDKNVNGHAVEIISSQIGGGLYLDWAEVEPSIDLFSTTTSIVADDVTTWPDRSDLSGLVYERFDSPDPAGGDPWRVRDRLAILGTQHPFDLAPYEAAAKVYGDHGRFADADRLRIVGRHEAARDAYRTARSSSSVLRRARAPVVMAGNWLSRYVVGYGFKPARVLGLIVALIAAVGLSLAGPWSAGDEVMRATGGSGVIYTPAGPLGDAAGIGPSCGGDVRCFQPAVYAIETVAPLIDLGQRGTWRVDSSTRFGGLYELWLTFATIAGWTLTTVFLLSFSRLGRTA